VRGGSTVLVVKPLGRSLGESRLLLTRFVVNVRDKLRRYSGEVRSVRRRQAACPSNRRAAAAAGAAQIFLGPIHHEVQRKVRGINTTTKLDSTGLDGGSKADELAHVAHGGAGDF